MAGQSQARSREHTTGNIQKSQCGAEREIHQNPTTCEAIRGTISTGRLVEEDRGHYWLVGVLETGTTFRLSIEPATVDALTADGFNLRFPLGRR